MKKTLFERFDGDQVTDAMLKEAADLFSQNYGTWSKPAESIVGPFAKAGSRVKLSAHKLRTEYLPPAISSYVRVLVNDRLAGNVFACRWTVDDRQVCWITQLVVHNKYRQRGLATGLLNAVKHHEDAIYGVMSSHPAACLAAAKAFGSFIHSVPLDFAQKHAEAVMKASPIGYVVSARPCGTLFNSEDTSGMISAVDTGFYVDHQEPLEALQDLRSFSEWPLGDLLDGHEFLLIIPAKRIRSKLAR